MGDRGNIIVRQDTDNLHDIFLYTHWQGSVIKGILQTAMLRGKSRWDDPVYLARIIFSEMIEGAVKEETGYGISTILIDNQRPLLVVDVPAQKVWEVEESLVDENRRLPVTLHGKSWSFKDFCHAEVEA
jgi:hypothetical protein